MGWAKGVELAKLARRDRQHFDRAIWLHKAREMPTEQFKQEVEKELTGRETEPWEIIYFQLYKSQLPVVEQAIEDRSLDAGDQQIPRLLFGNDLRRFLGGSELGKRKLGHSLAVGPTFFQIPPRGREADISAPCEREGIVNWV